MDARAQMEAEALADLESLDTGKPRALALHLVALPLELAHAILAWERQIPLHVAHTQWDAVHGPRPAPPRERYGTVDP